SLHASKSTSISARCELVHTVQSRAILRLSRFPGLARRLHLLTLEAHYHGAFWHFRNPLKPPDQATVTFCKHSPKKKEEFMKSILAVFLSILCVCPLFAQKIPSSQNAL